MPTGGELPLATLRNINRQPKRVHVKVAVPWVASVTLVGFGVGPLLFGAAAQLLFVPKTAPATPGAATPKESVRANADEVNMRRRLR